MKVHKTNSKTLEKRCQIQSKLPKMTRIYKMRHHDLYLNLCTTAADARDKVKNYNDNNNNNICGMHCHTKLSLAIEPQLAVSSVAVASVAVFLL